MKDANLLKTDIQMLLTMMTLKTQRKDINVNSQRWYSFSVIWLTFQIQYADQLTLPSKDGHTISDIIWTNTKKNSIRKKTESVTGNSRMMKLRKLILILRKELIEEKKDCLKGKLQRKKYNC